MAGWECGPGRSFTGHSAAPRLSQEADNGYYVANGAPSAYHYSPAVVVGTNRPQVGGLCVFRLAATLWR